MGCGGGHGLWGGAWVRGCDGMGGGPVDIR